MLPSSPLSNAALITALQRCYSPLLSNAATHHCSPTLLLITALQRYPISHSNTHTATAAHTHSGPSSIPLSIPLTTAVDTQEIRSLPCQAGGLICFSHRLIHWGTKPNPYGAAPPRVALSFAAASDDFEKPHLHRKYLPIPPLAQRIALVSAQILSYSHVVDPGPQAAALYFGIFDRHKEDFDVEFTADVVARTKWLAEQHGVDDPTLSSAPAAASDEQCWVTNRETVDELTEAHRAKEHAAKVEAMKPVWEAANKKRLEEEAACSSSSECEADFGAMSELFEALDDDAWL